MKKCSGCERELPEEMFHKSSISKDGLYYICKECAKERYKERRRRNEVQKGANPELEKFTPRELIAELRARGYRGELRYENVIKV